MHGRRRRCSSGNVLLFIFFASAGAAGGPVAAVLSYPALFGFLALLYLVHLSVMLVVGKGGWRRFYSTPHKYKGRRLDSTLFFRVYIGSLGRPLPPFWSLGPFEGPLYWSIRPFVGPFVGPFVKRP